MKAFKDFVKPFEAPQKSVKIKIYFNFFSSSGIATGRVKRNIGLIDELMITSNKLFLLLIDIIEKCRLKVLSKWQGLQNNFTILF